MLGPVMSEECTQGGVEERCTRACIALMGTLVEYPALLPASSPRYDIIDSYEAQAPPRALYATLTTRE